MQAKKSGKLKGGKKKAARSPEPASPRTSPPRREPRRAPAASDPPESARAAAAPACSPSSTSAPTRCASWSCASSRGGSWSTLTAAEGGRAPRRGRVRRAQRPQPEAMDRGVLVCRSVRRPRPGARRDGSRRRRHLGHARGGQPGAPSCAACARRRAWMCTWCQARRRPASSSWASSAACTSASGSAVVVDIGGGSTEIAAGRRARGRRTWSRCASGAIRLTAEFPEPAGGRPRARQGVRGRCGTACRPRPRACAGTSPASAIDVVYGTSGTIRNLASVVVRTLRDEHAAARGHDDARRAAQDRQAAARR